MRGGTSWIIAAALFWWVASLPAYGQTTSEPLDRRFAFDSSIRDPSRITAIINRIEAEERSIDAQLNELSRNKGELNSIISQFRNLSIQTRVEPVAVPKELAGLATAAGTDAQIDLLRKNVSAIETFSRQMEARDQGLAKLREIVPRRTSPAGVGVRPDLQFRNELANRMSRQFETLTSQCSAAGLKAAIAVLNKQKDDPNRYDDVILNNDGELVSTVQSCIDSAPRPINAEEIRNTIIGDLTTFATELDGRIARLNATLGSLSDAKTKWQGLLRRSTDISNSLIDWTIPMLAIGVVVLLAIPALYKSDVQQVVISNGLILEVFTVFLLITTVLVLGIAERIQSEALGTLLGGISGFVLGRSVSQKPQPNGSESQGAGAETKPRPISRDSASPPVVGQFEKSSQKLDSRNK